MGNPNKLKQPEKEHDAFKRDVLDDQTISFEFYGKGSGKKQEIAEMHYAHPEEISEKAIKRIEARKKEISTISGLGLMSMFANEMKKAA